MKWYNGSVEDAVNEANKKKSFFVVYIEGFDRSSDIMTDILNSQEISAILESDNYVSVRVKFDSEEYHHFVQLYKHVPVPSVFVIGLNGIPISIVKNLYGEDAKTLHQQIKNALLTKGKGLAGNLIQVDVEDSTQPDLICKETIALNSLNVRRDKSVNDADEISVHENFDFLNSPTTVVVDSSRESKTESDVEKQNKKEINVSSNTNSSTNFKQTMNEVEKDNKKDNIVPSRSYLKSKRQINNNEDFRKQEIQQEKIRNERDRQRILYDIAMDKQERMLRQQIEQHPASNNLTETNPSTDDTSLTANETQIQFRKPDGLTHTKIFDKSSTINELHSYVVEHICINSRRFKLGTAFPRHIFSDDESGKSLEELNLVPNAVIIIIPIFEDNSVMTYMYSQVYHAVTYVTNPVVNFFCFIRNSLFRTSQPQIQQGVLRPQQVPDSPSAASRIAARNRKLSHQGNSMGQKNVHTMSNLKNKKEDRNNVWNGNSTQQTQ